MTQRWLTICLAAVIASGTEVAQVHAQSLPETVECINKARVTTRILFVTAHPDDEWSSLLTYLSRGLHADVALLTITRGQGGQNALGPEQGDPLGVIRTEELLAADSHYRVRQFFTRAPDTGYVKTSEQAMKIWGDAAMEDMVRVIRTFRPQVVINGWGGVHGGHGHHQASGILTPQAVAAAAQPAKFPEQLAEGLAPWKVTLELRLARDTTKGAVELPVNDVSPLWGQSYVEMGMQGHAQHRSQGTPRYFGDPFFRRPVYLIAENEKGEAAGSFDAKLLAQPLASLASRLSSGAKTEPALAAVDNQLAAAAQAALELDRAGAAKSLAQAGKTIDAWRDEIAKLSGADVAAALFEIDRVRERIDRALADDVALPLDAQAERHEVVAGESFSVDLNFPDKPAVSAKWGVATSSLVVPPGWSVALESKEHAYTFKVRIPAEAKPPASPGDVILPFPPPLVKLALRAELGGYEFTIEKPVESVEATTMGIATYPLALVPAVTLTVEPQQVMLPATRAAAPVDLVARVRYHGTKPAEVAVGLDAPRGWQVEPVAPVDFGDAGDQLVRFVVTPPLHTAPGGYTLRPFARIGNQTFRESLEPIPTLPTRQWSEASDAYVHVLDLAIPAGLRVGYVAAANDPLPEILRQLGIRLDLLDDLALAFGDLSRYDAVAVGIRAYELRPDLPRSNARLLDYVREGGTLVVQYQRDFAWNKNLPAPFLAKMPEQTSRVTDANSPVRFLAPECPLLNTPNKITAKDFDGWVQERGLYFWGEFDSRYYHPVLGLKDPGEGECNGSLVFASDGGGLYIYTGLSFFRELPAGVPGAYRLFVNLLSQTQKHKAASD